MVFELADFVSLNVLMDIQSLFIPSSCIEDNLVWGLTSRGDYSVQSETK